MIYQSLKKQDPEIAELIQKEIDRQKNGLVMIPSENHCSVAVLEAMGTVLSNKYAEGYPQKRYYTGNQYIDQIEQLAIDRAKKLFSAEHANVQPNAGSPANLAIYLALLKPGDKVMGMKLDQGGHLTHGHPVNLSGQLYNFVQYGVRQDTELIDLDEIREIAKKEKPKMIVTGATAYPRIFDFKAFRKIADEVGALLMADISHFVGLCLSGDHPKPFPKAVCFAEAQKPEFIEYGHQIVKNAKALAAALLAEGIELVSGGTDNHLMLIKCAPLGLTGRQGSERLALGGIYTNRNTVPYDTGTPFEPTGIRLGTPALTTRGMKEEQMAIVGKIIAKVLKNIDSEAVLKELKETVAQLTKEFPVYPGMTI